MRCPFCLYDAIRFERSLIDTYFSTLFDFPNKGGSITHINIFWLNID